MKLTSTRPVGFAAGKIYVYLTICRQNIYLLGSLWDYLGGSVCLFMELITRSLRRIIDLIIMIGGFRKWCPQNFWIIWPPSSLVRIWNWFIFFLYYKTHATSLTSSTFPWPPLPLRCGHHIWRHPYPASARGIIDFEFVIPLGPLRLTRMPKGNAKSTIPRAKLG